jgi:GT2 family glycosyltransferase
MRQLQVEAVCSKRGRILYMKLSIIILCWNDKKVIDDCLKSIYSTTLAIDFEVIVSDNGSTDGSIDLIRGRYPEVRVIENGQNLRFAKGNNVGIRESRGDYLLILNPDTIINPDTLDEMVKFADQHPEAAAFGCKVLNADGSYQISGRPFTTIRGEWIAALYLRPLGYLCNWFTSDLYMGWTGETERPVDWLSGCFILARSEVLRRIGGFDAQFFYYYEDMDLCRRIWEAGHQILYVPDCSIIHLKGESTNKRLPAINFILDSQITRYLYYCKYYGKAGLLRARRVSLVSSFLRWLGYSLMCCFKLTENRKQQVESLRTLLRWTYRTDPIRLVESGEEPNLGTTLVGRVLER